MNAGNTQTSFREGLCLLRRLDKLRIDQHVELSVDIENDNSLGNTDLRGRQPHAIGANHGLDHLLANLPRPGIDRADGTNHRIEINSAGCIRKIGPETKYMIQS